jgi:integrase
VLSDAEICLFWRACAELGRDGSYDSYPYGELFKVLLLTAQRRNETASMELEEINEHNGIWTIPAGKAKGKSIHDVFLSAPAWDIVMNVTGEGQRYLPKFVFSRVEGKPVCGFSQAKRELDATMTRLNKGKKIPPWRIHDLRRSAATIMTRSLKIPPHVVDRVLAHKPKGATGVAGVYDRYQYMDERKDALEQLGTYLVDLEARMAGKNVLQFHPMSA